MGSLAPKTKPPYLFNPWKRIILAPSLGILRMAPIPPNLAGRPAATEPGALNPQADWPAFQATPSLHQPPPRSQERPGSRGSTFAVYFFPVTPELNSPPQGSASGIPPPRMFSPSPQPAGMSARLAFLISGCGIRGQGVAERGARVRRGGSDVGR